MFHRLPPLLSVTPTRWRGRRGRSLSAHQGRSPCPAESAGTHSPMSGLTLRVTTVTSTCHPDMEGG